MRHKAHRSSDQPGADIDEVYWRKVILHKSHYDPEIGFDRYRWALRYGQMERRRRGENVKLDQVLSDLAEGWKDFGGPSRLTWEQARAAVADSWNNTETLVAESIANQGGFKSSPTFTEHGSRVPRNIDEPNA